MPRSCIFCGGRSGLTAEHIFPDWLTKFYEARIKGPMRGTIEFVGPDGQDVSFRGTPFQRKVKTVCGDCNNGWMSALEGRMKPFLSRMIVGETTRLRSNAQKTVAFWCVKTAFVLQYMNPGTNVVPQGHYSELYKLKSALPTNFVVISSRGIPRGEKGLPMMQAMSDPVIHIKAIESGDADAQEQVSQLVRNGYKMYKITFAVGNFVAQVFGCDLPMQIMVAGGGPAISLWPEIRNRIDWSERFSIDRLGGLITFHRMMAAPPPGMVGPEYFTEPRVSYEIDPSKLNKR